jgi:hypothetical protein
VAAERSRRTSALLAVTGLTLAENGQHEIRLCAVPPRRFATLATLAFRSSGNRIVVVADIGKLLAMDTKTVAQM